MQRRSQEQTSPPDINECCILFLLYCKTSNVTVCLIHDFKHILKPLSLRTLEQFERHKKFIGDYILYYGGKMVDFKRST